MALVRDVLAQKGADVLTVSPDLTVLEAARAMNDRRVGAAVVSDGDQVVGIFTERDMLRRIVAEERSPSQTAVREVMTPEVICCQGDTRIDEARGIFMNRRIRHLPVVDEQGQLEGLISIGDINAWQLDGQEVTIKYLHQYLYGVV